MFLYNIQCTVYSLYFEFLNVYIAIYIIYNMCILIPFHFIGPVITVQLLVSVMPCTLSLL